MSTPTTRKRARTDSEEVFKEDPEQEVKKTHAVPQAHHANPDPGLREEHQIQRDAELWFSDGTVILVAKYTEFRIYRGLLADYSPVFKTMFAAPHPPRMVPVDGHQSIACPVVQLTDSSEDLRHILRAYVLRKQTRFFEEAKPSFSEISAYIRLGQKYEFTELYEQSLQFLKGHYTDDLATWQKHQNWEPSTWRECEAIGVVNLARLINEPSLLPTALMACVYTDQGVVRGFETEGGTYETLALDDLERCFLASRHVREGNVTAILRTFQDKVSPTCSKEKSCRAALHLALRTLEGRMDWLMASGPFLTYHQLLEYAPMKLGTCVDCTAMVEERCKKECEAFWARLPELFDVEVPDWGGDVPY